VNKVVVETSETAGVGVQTIVERWFAWFASPLGVVLKAVWLLVTFAGLFLTIQFATPGLVGNDGYYHMKMGYLIRQEGLTPDFTALPLTTLNEADYYDHHLLFHVYLTLFAPVDPAVDGGRALTLGGKVASVLLPSLAFVVIWWLLRAQRVPGAAFWAIGLFVVSEAFLYRMVMPRAQSGSLLILALGLHWLLLGRYRLLLPLGFLYVWFYNAFPLLLVMAAVYVATTLVLERRLVSPALVYPAVGIALGVIINPYFPHNVEFIISHILPKVGESGIRVGNEWTPYQTWTLVENSGLALAAVVLAVLALGWHKERIGQPALVALGLAAVFGYMLFQSRRFVEYFPPFALIFLALSATPLLRDWLTVLRQRWSPGIALLPLVASLALAYPLYVTVRDARELVRDTRPADYFSHAALWLHDNTPGGAMIFQTDWDDFTRLFFYHDDARYTAGLDPTFLQLQEPELYEQWVEITQGRVERPGAVIGERFAADYVFSDLNHGAFLEAAAGDPGLEELYRDDDAVIFAVRR
jgi:hypothetical protein